MTEYSLLWKGKAVRAELNYDAADAALISEMVQKYIDGVYVGDVTFPICDGGCQARAYMTTEMATYYKQQMIENGTWQCNL